MRRKQRPSREKLDWLYHDKGLSLDAIGAREGVAGSTVWRWMTEYNIPLRGPGRQTACPECEELHELRVHRRLSLERLAEHYSVSVTAIRGWLARCGLGGETEEPSTRAASLPREGRLLRHVAHTESVPQTRVIPFRRKKE